jgi:hypothetical protein
MSQFPMYVQYPNMSDNPYDYDHYFNELVILAKDKKNKAEGIKSVISGVTLFAFLCLPFYFDYPFLLFIQRVITWLVVFLVCSGFFVVFGSEGNYFTKTIKESVVQEKYTYLLSQIGGYTSKGFDKFITSNFISAYIILYSYIAYSSYWLFGFNYLLAGFFFISAIAIKAALFNSWKNLKNDLKIILREEDILIEDLVKKVEDWKVIN